MFVGVFTTMAAIALTNPEDFFRPGAPPPFGWQLVTLSVACIYLIVGGFTAGAIAGRREIGHAAGLALFAFLISLCPTAADGDATQPPMWYTIAGYALLLPSTVLGGWLRMKRRILLGKESEGLIRVTSPMRYWAGVAVSLGTFIVTAFLGLLLGAIALALISQTPLGGSWDAYAILPVFVLSVLLSFRLSRFLFRKITGEGGPWGQYYDSSR